MRTFVATLALGLLASSCNEKLDKETARAAIVADYARRDGARCTWTDLSQVTSEVWAFLPFDRARATCAAQLEEQGFLEVGPCQEAGCTTGCCKQLVKAAGKAVFETDKPAGLDFPCGEIEIGEVTSVATTGNEAAVKFQRLFKPGPVLEKLRACKLDVPEPRDGHLTWKFRRDDDGSGALTQGSAYVRNAWNPLRSPSPGATVIPCATSA